MKTKVLWLILCFLTLLLWTGLSFPFVRYSIDGTCSNGEQVEGVFFIQPSFSAVHIIDVDIDSEWNMMNLEPSSKNPLTFTFNTLGESRLVISYRLFGLKRYYKIWLHAESQYLTRPNLIIHALQTNELGHLIKGRLH